MLTMFKFRIRQDARIDYAALSDTSLEEKNMLDPISKSSMVKSWSEVIYIIHQLFIYIIRYYLQILKKTVNYLFVK